MIVPHAPAINAQCYAAPFRIATDNVPVGNGVPTSVVDIWAYASPNHSQAIGWLYKNALGDRYIQWNSKVDATNYTANAVLGTLFRRPKVGTGFVPVRVSAEQLPRYDAAFARIGSSRTACFTHDYHLAK
jgi:hypothetical protein